MINSISVCSVGATGPTSLCAIITTLYISLISICSYVHPHMSTRTRPGDVALMLPVQQKKAFGCAVEHVGREDVVLKVSMAAKEQW